MTEVLSEFAIAQPEVRTQLHKGELYFSVVDIFSTLLGVGRKQARNQYHVLKNRMVKNRDTLPKIVQLKAITFNNKMYLTDFTDEAGKETFTEYILSNLKRRKKRIEILKTDEVANFHVKVLDYLKTEGLKTYHHVTFPSGAIIDILAWSEEKIFIIECKPELSRQKLYTAIGQVLCYCQEYKSPCVPVIATYESEVGHYSMICCSALGIDIIAIPYDNIDI